MQRALFAFLMAMAARAEEPACGQGVQQWLVGRGELLPDVACGSFFLTTDAEDHDASLGDVSWKEPVRAPYQLEVTVRRLSPEGGRTLWIKALGADVMLKDGAVGLFVDHAQHIASGLQRLPGFSTHQRHRVVVRQALTSLEVRIDGGAPLRFALEAPRAPGKVGIGFNGGRAFRSRLQISGFLLKSLR